MVGNSPPFADLPDDEGAAGLNAADRALLAAKAVPHPFATDTQPLRLTGSAPAAYERVIIAREPFRAMVATGLPRLQGYTPPDWRVEHLSTGHWPMLSAPAAFADVLDRLGENRGT